MIRSFRCPDTKELFEKRSNRRWSTIAKAALRKLDQIDASVAVDELRIPPGNRLELLRGDRSGEYSIRINDQYRVCFLWRGQDALAIEIVDYH